MRPLWGECPVTNALSSIKFTFSPLSHLILSSPEHSQDALLEYSDVRRTCGRLRRLSASTFCLCTSRGHSSDQIYMKLCQNVNVYEI